MASAAISITWLFGFWGQLIYEINAWSQIASVAINICIIRVGLDILKGIFSENEDEPEDRDDFRAKRILLVILFAGSLSIYAENAIVHFLLILGMYVIIAILPTGRKKVKKRDVIYLAICFFAVFILNVISNWRVLSFALRQVSNSTLSGNAPKPWWRFFNNYWTGFWNSGDYFLKKAICFIPSYFGFSFIMPDMASPLIIRIPWIIFTVLLTLGIIALLIYITVYKIFTGDETEKLFGACIFTGLVGAFYFIPFQKLWESGKMMTYISPYLYLGMTFTVFKPEKCQRLREIWGCKHEAGSENKFVGYHYIINKYIGHLILAAACVLIITNVLFAFYGYGQRIANARGNGIGGAFPSDQIPIIKEKFNFDYCTDIIDPSVKLVELDVDHGLGENRKSVLTYLKFKTYYAGIDYYVDDDTNLWFSNEIEEISQPVHEKAKQNPVTNAVKVKVSVQKGVDGFYETVVSSK
ncbi:MAG: hypothetical protein K5770_20030 [Lachnospiraceae bacterium]|nr:hypothetical protein [Lachnospiraceae bacterium]